MVESRKLGEWTILKTLLVSSTIINEEIVGLPTIKQFILSEIINGTIEYVGGDAGQITYTQQKKDPNFSNDLFADRICKHFEEEIKNYGMGLDPNIRKAITKLVKYSPPQITGPELSEPYIPLYSLFYELHPPLTTSTWSLPYETVRKVKDQILPFLFDSERRDINGIANCMRKYIQEDLTYIREHYHW